MKTLILLLTTLLFAISCTDERESEHFNPAYEIKVNFTTKDAWESGVKLQKASVNENQICEKIINGQTLPQNIKFSNLCSGGNDKGLNFAYVIISGEVNGYFLISYDENRVMAHKIKQYNSSHCGLRWITEN
ncbi:MAG: hypothetical protein RSE50_00925 [Myroides sp.]